MKLRYQAIGDLLSIGLAVFGAWSLCVQVVAVLGGDFAILRALSIPVVLGAIAFLVRVRRDDRQQSSADACTPETCERPDARLPQWFWLVAPVLAAGLYWATGSEWLFWLTSTAYLFAASRACSSDPVLAPIPDSKVPAWELTVLVGLCGVAALLSLGANRPDADDALFVSLASSAIDRPGEPLYGFDSLYRSGLPLAEQYLHFGQSHEYLIAALAAFSKVPVRVLYYVVFPALWSLAGMLVHWYVLRRFLPGRPALVGLAGLVVLLAVWGDGARTFGNFAFVRIYQGKAICLLVALPMIFHTALEYRNTPHWRNWLFLMLHQCAAVGFTANGLVIAPLTSALVLLSGMQFTRQSWRGAAKGLAASLPLALVGIAMAYHLRHYHALGQVDPLFLGYRAALGGHRASLVLLGLLMLPALSRMARVRESSWLGSYVFVSASLLLCPAVSSFLGMHFARVFSWRIFWCCPVPLLLGLTIGSVASRSLPRPWLRGCLLGVALVAFALAGPSAVSRGNWAWTNIGAFKVSPDYGVAQRLMLVAPDSGLALVPEDLAVDLCGFQGARPLIAVRLLYLKKLRGAIPEEDWTARADLLAYIGGTTGSRTMGWVMGEIDRRGVTTVAFRSTHPDADALVKSLAGRGFRVIPDAGYWLAVRSLAGK
jgi:hypothetical protein